MKKRLHPLLFILSALIVLAACGGNQTPPAATTPANASSEASLPPENTENQSGEDEDALADPPRIEMLAQAYSENIDQIIEVPQLISEKPSDALDSINQRILEFAANYEQFLNSPSESEWMQLKCYPLLDEKYATIILTRAAYPNYGTYGDIVSFCYDYQEDKEFTFADMIQADGIDMVNPESKLLALIPEGFELKQFEPVAGAPSQMGPLYFYNAFIGLPVTEEGDIRKALYLRYPDGSYEEYDNERLALGVLEPNLVTKTPPLFWEK
jgi:hypothetical protein